MRDEGPRGAQSYEPGSGGRALRVAEPGQSSALSVWLRPSPGLPSPGEEAAAPGAAVALPLPAPLAPARRERFETSELAVVCSHYDLGVIEAVKESRRGSSRSPKVVLKTTKGRYLLKRRPAGRHGVERVRFCHGIQFHLAHRGFPLPKLVRTRSGESLLALEERVYEVFAFVEGNAYDSSLDATGDAGRLLAAFHRLASTYHDPRFAPIASNYHAAPGLAVRLATISRRHATPEMEGIIARLGELYDLAAQRVEEAGFASWPHQIIHGDWHPGNMLFRGSRVAVVIDYDTARLSPRAIDIANAALQFSITMNGEDPASWPAEADEGRLKRFCRAYDLVPGAIISTAEVRALPWLMIEALIVEAAVPIAATGTFAGLEAGSFLRMVDAKSAWLAREADRLIRLLGD